nr:glycine--tRNA ligase subunit beta [Wolbachia endosymbiont of Glossina morsitans morsitans]
MDKRKQFILDQINKFTKEQNLQLEKNDYLLNELTGLIEWPIVLFGEVNQEKSFGLPKEVILSIVNTQQKYLALSNGERISHFVTVVNVNNGEVVEGHERILEARLADAQFLISQDKKENLDYYVKNIRFDIISCFSWQRGGKGETYYGSVKVYSHIYSTCFADKS